MLGSEAHVTSDRTEVFSFGCDRISEIGTPHSEQMFRPARRRVAVFPPAVDLRPLMSDVDRRAYAVYEYMAIAKNLVGVVFETDKATLGVRCSVDLPEATEGTMAPSALKRLLAATELVPLTSGPY